MAAEAEDAARQARQLYEQLVKQKKGGRASWWSSFEVLLDDTGDVLAAKLVCKRCSARLTGSNASRTASDHLKSRNCQAAASVQLAAAEAAAAAAAAAEPDPEPSKKRPAERNVATYMASTGQVTQARASNDGVSVAPDEEIMLNILEGAAL
jgi:hypothetical protein